jgi:peptidoglycan biosynthesis protein MviN/MurJ (putative lipid II flippase)
LSPRVYAALLSVAVESPIVAAFYRGQRLRMAIVCAVTTTVTNLAMNLVLVRHVSSASAFLAIGEGGAFVVEAFVYALVARPRDFPRAIAASAFANAASFALGCWA